MYFGKILRRQLDNANPKHTKKYNDSQKHRMKAKKKKHQRRRMNRSNRRQERLGDIFSSSLVRDVLYSAGWSLR